MNTSMREHYGSTNSSSSTDPKSVLTLTPANSRRKRTELSKSALKKVNLHQCDIVVTFG